MSAIQTVGWAVICGVSAAVGIAAHLIGVWWSHRR